MVQKIGGIFVGLGVDPKELEKGLNKAFAKLKEFGGQVSSIGSKISLFSAPIVAGFGLAIREASKFDAAMTKSTAIMGNLTDETKKQMADLAKEISKSSEFGASDLGDAYFFLASAGLDATQQLAALPRVTKFAEAGQFDLARATDLLTDAQSALGLKSVDAAENLENMIRVSDVLVKSNQLANATVAQFSEAMANMAGAVGRAAGKDVEEIGAVLAAFADQGEKGAAAGTKFAIVVRDLQKAAEGAPEAFREAGIKVFDETTEEMNNMADIIGDLEKRLAGMSTMQKRAALTSLQLQEKSLASLLALVGFSDAIREYEKHLRVAGGATEEVANNNLQAFEKQLKILVNQIRVVAIELGSAFLPVLIDLIKMFEKDFLPGLEAWAKSFHDLTPAQKKLRLEMIAFGAALGPVLVAVGNVISLVGDLGLAAATATIALSKVTTAIGGMGGNLARVAPQIALVAGAFVAAKLATSKFIETANTIADIAFKASGVEDLIGLPKETEKRLARVRADLGDLHRIMVEQGKLPRELGSAYRVLADELIRLERVQAKQQGTSDDQRTTPRAPDIKDFLTPVENALQGLDQRIDQSIDRVDLFSITNNDLEQQLQRVRAEVGTYEDAITSLESALGKNIVELAATDEHAAVLVSRYNDARVQALGLEKAIKAQSDAIEKQKRAVADAQAPWDTLFESLRTKFDEFKTFSLDFSTQIISHFQNVGTEVGQFITGTFSQIEQGLGNAVAQIVVFSKKGSEAFKDFGKSLAAFVISSLIAIIVRTILWYTIGQHLLADKLKSEMTAATALLAIWAAVASVKELGLFGIAAAPAFAAAAVAVGIAAAGIGAAAGAGAAAGISGGVSAAGSAADGAVVRGHAIMEVGEVSRARPEVIAPLRKLEGMLGGTGHHVIQFILDGQVVDERVVRKLPEHLELVAGVR